MKMEPSPLKLKRTPVKRRLSTDEKRCTICMTEQNDILRKASDVGISTFLKSMKQRIQLGDIETDKYIDSVVKYDRNEELTIIYPDTIYWHRNCYATFTSPLQIDRLKKNQKQTELPGTLGDAETGPSRAKIPRKSFDWNNLCLFCEQKSYKKDKNLIPVSSFEFCSTLENKAKELGDMGMNCKVGDYSKLIANSAHYHKNCHGTYLLKSTDDADTKTIKSESVYDKAVDRLVNIVMPHIKEGRAYLITDLLLQYRTILTESMTPEKANTYTAQKLRDKLMNKYPDKFSMIQTKGHGNPYFIIDKSLKLEDIVNSAAKFREALRSAELEADITLTEDTEQTTEMVLFHAAILLRSLQRDCQGIDINPLDPKSVSQDQEEQTVPKELYSFVSWLVSGERALTPQIVDMKIMKQKNSDLHQKILSICQDIIYVSSRGRCRTPKHVGASIAIHQLTQCKDAVMLLNKNGQGISYDEVERIDTCWAKAQQENEVIVPTNMKPGVTLRAAGDNFNRATEALDGKHLDIVNMVLYQTENENSVQGSFGSGTEMLTNKDRTLKDIKYDEILECQNMSGKQPGPIHLIGNIKMDWFFACSEAHRDARAIDTAYIELRLMPMKLFDALIDPLETQIPGWTIFHAKVTKRMQVPITKIGYCPMLPASATEFNTVYTMMKTFQKMFRSLGQDWTYVTYDEAIYSKAQMIKWRNRNEFSNDELDMGGMHRAMNFMGDIGKVMEESGFEDILIEGEVYGPSVVQVILKGRAYNRGVRAHKLMNETMSRLKWRAFERWLERKEISFSDEEKNLVADDVSALRDLLTKKKYTADDIQFNVNERIESLMIHTRKLHHLMRDFTTEGCNLSYTFAFWDNYVNDMSQLLLDYIGAKRDGNRDLELETFAEMLPYDFVCGHTNYARWGSINVAEGQLLKMKRPEIHQAISNELSAVYRTDKPFRGVWHDMAIEQSLNRECGKFKQLYTNEGALQKYYLTAHKKAEVTQNMKRMSGLKENVNEYKEGSEKRIDHDETAVRNLVSLVEDRMVNPFKVDDEASVDEKQPLLNIATSGVATNEIRDDLCNTRTLGSRRLTEFVSDRLQSNKTDFMAPIPRQNIKTFASMNKAMKVKTRDKVESVNIDRQVFSKLTVIGQSRDVDVKKLLTYELTPVPLSLFSLDGNIRKTTKSATLAWIEGGKTKSKSQIPVDEHPELLIIDLMMLLRNICTDKTKCQTFGEVAQKVATAVLEMKYKYTALVGDNYQNAESIKAGERKRRGDIQMQEIRNPTRETPLPKQVGRFLSNPANKINLADFVLREISEIFEHELADESVVYIGGGFKDPKKAVKVLRNSTERTEDLESDQEEADSRIFLHVDYAVKYLNVTSIVIWSGDSDVASMCPRISVLLGVKIFFKTGTKESKRYIQMHDVAKDFGDNIAKALPVIHALSGCDSTSSFYGIGKKRWSTFAMKDLPLLEGIAELGDDPIEISQKAKSSVTKSVSQLYCGKPAENIDDVRYELFSKKGVSSEKLPPTSDALNEHIKRVNFQSYIWKFATDQYLNLPSPLDAGWTKDEDEHIVPVKMTKPPAPEALLDFTKCSCKTDCQSRRCKCKRENLLCTDACVCESEQCKNKLEYAVSDSDEDE